MDDLDSIRGMLADGPNLEPPQLRSDHDLSMQARNESGEGDRELFDFATDLEDDMEDIRDAADRIVKALRQLTEAEYEDGEFVDDDEQDMDF